MRWFDLGKLKPTNSPLALETADATSSIHLSAMSDPEHQDYQLVILDVVDDTVVTDADVELSSISLELNTARRARVNGESINCLKQSTSR